MGLPIAQRLLYAKNDARHAGKVAVRARINPLDKKELESWVVQQNRPHISGLPQQNLSAGNIWGMDIIEDDKVKSVIILEFQEK